MKTNELRPGLLLDRDGVINHEIRAYVYNLSDFTIHSETLELIKQANQKKIPVGVISNQGGIDKGLYTHKEVEQIHLYLTTELVKLGAWIDSIYYCPHHPQVQNCLCRKPGTLLFERTIHNLKLDPEQCFMVGDREKDLIPAKKLGVKTIQVGNTEPVTPFADIHLPNTEALLHYFLEQIWK